MTSFDATQVKLIKAIVNAAITQSQRKTRHPGMLSGTVEDLGTDLDIAYVRMGGSTNSDPTVSDNYGNPGVAAVTRLGETFIGEQVRVTFDALAATANAMRTSVENKIVLPFGVEEGQRIILDGNEGAIGFFDENDQLVGFLDALQWFVGSSGAGMVRLDPIGGMRVWDTNDKLRVIVGAETGIEVREPVSGISGVTARHDGIIVADPATGETISISAGQTSSVPSPHWSSVPGTSATVTHGTPAISSFATGDDLDLRFISASAASALGAQSYTAPTSYTEQADIYESGTVSLGVSMATRDPAIASPGVANFTNTTSTFTRRIGHSVIVRGGGGTSPSFSAVESSAVQTFTGKTITTTFEAPASVADGQLVIAHVALAGGVIPIGWAVPEGWIQLGVQSAGVGTSHILGSGIWYKVYQTGEPLEETVIINMNAVGTTKVQALVATVADPYRFPVGLDIRRNNISMPRGQIVEEVEDFDTTVWTNATLPASVCTTDAKDYLAGRKYRVEFTSPGNEFGWTAVNCRMEINVERRVNGGSWTPTRLVFHRQSGISQVERLPIHSSFTYTPTGNASIEWRATLSNLVASTGYSVQMLAGTGGARRTLTVTDDGAEY